jgi:hypothetical protein
VSGNAFVKPSGTSEGMPASRQTMINAVSVSYPYVRGRGFRLAFRTIVFRFSAVDNARRALARDQPVTATRSSKILPLSFLAARA